MDETMEDGVSAALELMDPKTAADPQPTFKALRDRMPVITLDGMVLLTRKSEADKVFRNPELFSSNADLANLKNIRPLIPLNIDPPDHVKFRRLLDPIFAPRQMAQLEESVVEAVNLLIDSFIDKKVIDFSHEFSVPFPSRIFLTLFGLPLDELSRFLEMKDGIIRPHAVIGAPAQSPEADDYQRATAQSIYRYFNELLDARQKDPRNDLVSRFLEAEVEGEKLSREDILDICFLFLIAGLDTVSATLDCIFSYLVAHPDDRRLIVADPAIIPSAIEELLRWETPVQMVTRVATEDTELAERAIRKGDVVIVNIGSANTDERYLDDANLVRFNRDVNRHMAFGGGIHRCLGSHLARLELRVALQEWHKRIPEYSLEEGVILEYTPAIRSIERFPMLIASV